VAPWIGLDLSPWTGTGRALIVWSTSYFMNEYVVVVIAYDDAVSVCGPFTNEYEATVVANEIEAKDSTMIGQVYLLVTWCSGLGGAYLGVCPARLLPEHLRLRRPR